jgi:hypothetical protein
MTSPPSHRADAHDRHRWPLFRRRQTTHFRNIGPDISATLDRRFQRFRTAGLILPHTNIDRVTAHIHNVAKSDQVGSLPPPGGEEKARETSQGSFVRIGYRVLGRGARRRRIGPSALSGTALSDTSRSVLGVKGDHSGQGNSTT